MTHIIAVNAETVVAVRLPVSVSHFTALSEVVKKWAADEGKESYVRQAGDWMTIEIR